MAYESRARVETHESPRRSSPSWQLRCATRAACSSMRRRASLFSSYRQRPSPRPRRRGPGSQRHRWRSRRFKLVQDAVREVLEAIYEQDFLDCSYGFRPGRSAHDALRTLDRVVLSSGPS